MTWTFRSQRQNEEWTGVSLVLDWEVAWTSISDDYSPEDMDAHQLLRIWRQKYGDKPHPTRGEGFISIYWFVEGEHDETRQFFESAPFAYDESASTASGAYGKSFLT